MSLTNRIMKALAFLKATAEGPSVAQKRLDMAEGVMTLEINGAKWIQNPSDDEILNELASLRDEGGDSFAILGATDMTYIQVAGDQQTGFDLEYQEGSVDAHFKATDKNITLDRVVEAFIAFRDGDIAWQSGFAFEKIAL
jgi:hypothetical protein